MNAPRTLKRILETNREHFMRETLCVELSVNGARLEGGTSREVDVEGESATIALANA